MIDTLHKKIMRRIYYAYATRTLTNPVLLLGFFMLGLMIALTYFVSLKNVLANMLHAGIGHSHIYLYNALTNTEAWTLLLLGLLIFSIFSLRLKTRAPRRVVGFAR